MLISLFMYCFTALLTCLISQALLQAALDEVAGIFTGWMLHYEFSSLPVMRQYHCVATDRELLSTGRGEAARARVIRVGLAYQPTSLFQDYQSLAICSSFSASSHGSSSIGKSTWYK
jgi:hypothetical protein